MATMKQKLTVWIIIIGAVAIQFIPVPGPGNPPVQENIPVTPDTEVIFKKACYDCHSNETVWPWYSKVAPVSWMLSVHVMEGRDHVNMSEWNTYSPDKRIQVVREIDEEVQKGKMPLKFYILGHQDARLSQVDKEAVAQWADQVVENIKADSDSFK